MPTEFDFADAITNAADDLQSSLYDRLSSGDITPVEYQRAAGLLAQWLDTGKELFTFVEQHNDEIKTN